MQKASGIRGLFTRELIAIILVSGAGFFSQEILTPILSLYMRDIGFSDQNIGLAFSVMLIGVAISELFWGWAIDRINLKVILILGMFMYGVMTLVLMIPKAFPFFIFIIFIYGFSRSPVYIVGRWYMGVYAAEDVKAQAFAIMAVVISIPSSIAGFGSGFLVEAWGFQSTIWVAAAVPLAMGVFIIVADRWFKFQKRDFDQAASPAEEVIPSSVNGSAKVVTYFLGSFGVILFISLGVYMAYLPLIATDVANLSPSAIGTFFGVRGLIQAFAMLPLSKLADKVGKNWFVPLSMAIVAVSMFLLAASQSYTLLMASTVLYAIGGAMYFPTVSAILSENVPVSWVGTAMGIYGLLEDVGWLLGPAIAGLLLNYWSVPSTFVFSGLSASLGIPLFLWGKQKILGRTPQGAEAPEGAL